MKRGNKMDIKRFYTVYYEPVPSGTYMYIVKFRYKDGTSEFWYSRDHVVLSYPTLQTARDAAEYYIMGNLAKFTIGE